MKADDTTVEIELGFSFSRGSTPLLRITTGRKRLADGSWSNRQYEHRRALIADDFPTLLRNAADLYEQEGSWEAIAEMEPVETVEATDG